MTCPINLPKNAGCDLSCCRGCFYADPEKVEKVCSARCAYAGKKEKKRKVAGIQVAGC